MTVAMRLFSGILLFALAACSSPGTSSPALPRTAQDGTSAPAGSGGMALPGGSGGMALPGATLGCAIPTTTTGSASCTVAININIAALSNPTAPQSLIPGLHPADLTNAYALPSGNPGGTVAIVDAFDDPAAESDLAVYRSAYGLPPCSSSNGCFTKLNQSGATGSYPLADPGWAEEIALDLDMVSAICPKCSITLVEANSASIDDLGAAVDTAARRAPIAISNSYYANEWSGESAEDAHYLHPGIAVTASSGDQANPYYPAASPNVTAVGGTTLGSSGETAWTYSGRGCSAFERAPAWQHDTGCNNARSTVDVTAVGDPQTGVSIYDSAAGGWLVAGGTSVGAPLVAAAYALSANPQGPAFSYAAKSGFTDIPPLGYDQATGLGSPKGIAGL